MVFPGCLNAKHNWSHCLQFVITVYSLRRFGVTALVVEVSVMRTRVDPENLLHYEIDGHSFGLKPLTSILNEEFEEEYEGAVEEKLYLLEKLYIEERQVKRRMNRIYFELVHLDYYLSTVESKLSRIKLLQSTLFYPSSALAKSNDLCDDKV